MAGKPLHRQLPAPGRTRLNTVRDVRPFAITRALVAPVVGLYRLDRVVAAVSRPLQERVGPLFREGPR